MDKTKSSTAAVATKPEKAGDPAPPGDASPTAPNGNGHASLFATDEHDRAIEVLDAMLALRGGNFSARLPCGWTGIFGKIADAFNDVASMNKRRSDETSRVCRVVGKEGKLKQRMRV